MPDGRRVARRSQAQTEPCALGPERFLLADEQGTSARSLQRHLEKCNHDGRPFRRRELNHRARRLAGPRSGQIDSSDPARSRCNASRLRVTRRRPSSCLHPALDFLPNQRHNTRGAIRSGGGVVVLEHDPEKWIPLFGKRSCSTNKLQRDAGSTKSHPAVARHRLRRDVAEPGGRIEWCKAPDRTSEPSRRR